MGKRHNTIYMVFTWARTYLFKHGREQADGGRWERRTAGEWAQRTADCTASDRLTGAATGPEGRAEAGEEQVLVVTGQGQWSGGARRS
ncbi:hypothetical protein SESBI_12210 [Sesbania bispinosa]|nr:hypothetical protein SESBI_12210 [Sesbania bispinosa]